MKMKTKFLFIVLALTMTMAMVVPGVVASASSSSPNALPPIGERTRADIIAHVADFPAPTGYVVTRASIAPDANIFTAAWTNPASLAQARAAMHGMGNGLGTMSRDTFNEPFPNPMVMVGGAWPVVRDDANGNRTYTFTIYTDNRFSDGTPITAHHYAASVALLTSRYWDHVAPVVNSYPELYARAEWLDGTSNVLRSVRIHSDYGFSITMRAEGFPNVWEAMQYMYVDPIPIHAMGLEIHDAGAGVFLTGPDRAELTLDMINLIINGGSPVHSYETDADGNYVYADGERVITGIIGGDGWRFNPTVSDGPYVFESVDVGAGTVTIVANPYFPGTWDGYLPRIERVIWRYVPVPLTMDAVAAGEIHMADGVTVGDIIADGFTHLIDVPNPQHTFISYPNHGQTIVQFHVDHGPTRYRAVRAAIAYMIDRHMFAELFGRGFATVPHSIYSPAWWWYQRAMDETDMRDRFIIYDLNMAEAIRLLEEDGWNYNADGTPFVGPGTGGNHIRHKWTYVDVLDDDGNHIRIPTYDEDGVLLAEVLWDVEAEWGLMPLHIMWCTAVVDRPSRDILYLQLPDNMAYAGMGLTQNRYATWPTMMMSADREYHMWDVGIGMPVLWMPWWLMSPAGIPSSNWGNINWPHVQEIAYGMRDGEVNTPEGQRVFVERFADLMVILNYEMERIPLVMLDAHDFIPLWLGNWHATGLWDFGMGVVRAYDTRN